MKTFLVTFALLAGTTALFSQLPPADPNARFEINGTVLDFDTGKPVSQARVALYLQKDFFNSTIQPQITLLTGDTGAFQIRSLPEGNYRLEASRPSYMGPTDGAPKSIATVFFDSRSRTRSASPSIQLRKQAVIEGTALDASGQPVPGSVHMHRLVLRNGRDEPQNPTQFIIAPDGSFRIPLQPGPYYFQLVPLQEATHGGQLALAPEFFPSADSLANARLLTLVPGQEEQIHVRPTKQPSYRIRTALPSGSSPYALQRLADAGLPTPGHIGFGKSSDGRFEATGLFPGRYLISSGNLRATVNLAAEDVDEVQFLPAAPPSALSGTVRYEERPPQPQANPQYIDRITGAGARTQNRYLRITRANGDEVAGAEVKNGAFTIQNLPPGDYKIKPSESLPWYVKSVRQSGRDVTHLAFTIGTASVEPVEVVIAASSAFVSYTATDTSKLTHVAFFRQVGRDYQFVTRGVLGAQGGIRPPPPPQVDGLPPGDYLVFAWEGNQDVDRLPYNTPAFLEKYSALAHRLTVRDFDKLQLQINRLLPLEAFRPR